MGDKERILVTVKTYPTLSAKVWGDGLCCGATRGRKLDSPLPRTVSAAQRRRTISEVRLARVPRDQAAT